jgi:hypothetical protein
MINQFDDLQEFLESLPGPIQILEEGINMEVQDEYMDYTNSIVRMKLSDEEVELKGTLLLDNEQPIEDIKNALAMLAFTGSPTAFNFIRLFYEKSENELKAWTLMALYECQVFLESDLTDTDIGFISSGLGAKNNKLRYFFLILPLEGQLFNKVQHKILETELTITAKSLECEIEGLDFQESFVGLTVLIPMDVAISKFIDMGINMSNEFGEFVLEHYYATNTEIPSPDEIPGILEIVLNG